MHTATKDELELLEHIKARNTETQAWIDAGPGRWASFIPCSLEFIRERNYASIAVYDRNCKEATLWDLYKDVNGFRPRHLNIGGMTDAELDFEIEFLSKQCERQIKEEQAAFQAEVAKEKELCERLSFDIETLIRWEVIDQDAPWKHLRNAA